MTRRTARATLYAHIRPALGAALNGLLRIFTLPYFRVMQRNTSRPFHALAAEPETHEIEIRKILDRWLTNKIHEARYVLVAGAVLFAAVPSCLSWITLASSHWTASALWYVSIVLAITGTVFGGQQILLLPEKTDTRNWHIFYDKLTVETPDGLRKARKSMIFAWQCPVMCLAYSVTCFMGGLMSVVFSPIAMNPAWNNDAKTAVIFFAGIAFAFVSFVEHSRYIYCLEDAA